jgi:tetratricopeptide (TPR) repeat protein
MQLSDEFAAMECQRAEAEPESFMEFLGEMRYRAARGEPWDDVAVGYLALRAAAAVEEGEFASDYGVAAIRDRLEMLDGELTGKDQLSRLLNLLEAPNRRHDGELMQAIEAYGQELQYHGMWHVAAEVFAFSARHFAHRGLHRLEANAYVTLGGCHRHCNRLPKAETVLVRAAKLASECGDRLLELRARIGLATVARRRGNYPVAAESLCRILEEARALDLIEIQSVALHDLGNIEAHRGKESLGLSLLGESLSLCKSETHRDRISADRCFILARMHDFEAARAGYLPLTAARERLLRWAAHINLMHIAFACHDRSAFEHHAHALSRARLTAELSAVYQMHLGEGLLVFGECERAEGHLRHALAIAEEGGYGDLVIEAGRLISEARRAGRGEKAGAPMSGPCSDRTRMRLMIGF